MNLLDIRVIDDRFDDTVDDCPDQVSNYLQWTAQNGDHIEVRFHRIDGEFCSTPSYFEVSVNHGTPRRAYQFTPVKAIPGIVARLLHISLTEEQYAALKQMQQR